MSTIKTNRGFTLIEVIIYIALFTFVIGGALAASFNLFQGSANIKAKALQEMELNFVLRKLDWALSGAAIVNPSAGSSDNNLIVNKDGSQYRFFVDGTDTLSIFTSGNTEPLTSNQLNITNLDFNNVSGSPDVMEITMDVNGESIGPIKRYVRE